MIIQTLGSLLCFHGCNHESGARGKGIRKLFQIGQFRPSWITIGSKSNMYKLGQCALQNRKIMPG